MDSLERAKAVFCERDFSKLDEAISSTGDELESIDLSTSEAIAIINYFFSRIHCYSDGRIIENILHVCLRIMNAHQVFSGFDLDGLLPCLGMLNRECSSYILTFLGFSGDMKYEAYIEPLLADEGLRGEAEEALRELRYGAGRREE